jgi:hypothetical protein
MWGLYSSQEGTHLQQARGVGEWPDTVFSLKLTDLMSILDRTVFMNIKTHQ